MGIVVGGGKGFLDCDDEEDCVDEGSGSGDGFMPEFMPPAVGDGGGGGGGLGGGLDDHGEITHTPGGTDSESTFVVVVLPSPLVY